MNYFWSGPFSKINAYEEVSEIALRATAIEKFSSVSCYAEIIAAKEL